MKKKVLAAVLCASMTLTFAGCSSELSNEYVTVKQYKGLEVTQVEKTEVTDEDVEETVQSYLSYDQEEVDITDRAAELGDYVDIDYVGSVDGVEFDGGTASGATLELGSGTYIGANGDYEGFEDQIVGHSTGDEFDITVQFPDDYTSEDLAGQVADFHIILNRIYGLELPELTDEWVCEMSETSTTVDEYKEEIRAELEESNESTWMSSMQSNIIAALQEQVEVTELPQDQVDEMYAEYETYYTTMASYYGMEYADFLTYAEITEDQLMEAAEQNVALTIAIELIAEKEGLTVTDDQYAEEIEELATTYGFSTSDEFVEYYGEEDIRSSITQENVFEYLIDKCVQVEVED